MKSDEARHIDGLSLEPIPDWDIEGPDFPSDVLWIGVNEYPLDILFPIFFGAKSQYSPGGMEELVRGYFENSDEYDGIRIPNIVDGVDIESGIVSPRYPVIKKNPSKMAEVEGTDQPASHQYARYIHEKIQNENYVSKGKTIETDNIIEIPFSISIAGKNHPSQFPISIGKIDDRSMDELLTRTKIPIVILTDEDYTGADHPKRHPTPCVFHPMTLPRS